MTRKEVMLKAMSGKILWTQAADIIGITDRQLRRIRDEVKRSGWEVITDRRGGRLRRKRVSAATVKALCTLRIERYMEFSLRHFYEFATEKHKLKLSYTTARTVLQDAGLALKGSKRGQYRRKRERRPMVGMLLHMDGSTHEWIEGLAKQDLIVMLDDADGRILYAQFWEQEGNASTFGALRHVLEKYGRFCELYTDRGSHFCNTTKAEDGPDEVQRGQVPRALKAVGIRQILARSPQARGRSERAFGTIQGRLPQELKLAGTRSYTEANEYLTAQFVGDFNRRFTVKPLQAQSAFTPVVGINLDLLLSSQHERVVRNDSTVTYDRLVLQLPSTKDRPHYVRCPVLVHELSNGTLGISYQGLLLARYSHRGELVTVPARKRKAA